MKYSPSERLLVRRIGALRREVEDARLRRDKQHEELTIAIHASLAQIRADVQEGIDKLYRRLTAQETATLRNLGTVLQAVREIHTQRIDDLSAPLTPNDVTQRIERFLSDVAAMIERQKQEKDKL